MSAGCCSAHGTSPVKAATFDVITRALPSLSSLIVESSMIVKNVVIVLE